MRRVATTIVIAGPDGAGKTTLAARLTEVLAPPILHLHHRPGVLPRRSISAGPVTAPHAEEPYARGRSLLKLAYLFLDYGLGWWLKVRPVRRRGGSVLLERGWWDLAIDPRRYRLASTRWPRFLARLLPEPDLTVILVADPRLLSRRKDELPASELSRQVQAWRQIGRRPGTIILDAGMPVASLVDEVHRELTSQAPPG